MAIKDQRRGAWQPPCWKIKKWDILAMDWQRLTKFGMVMRLRLRQPVTFCDFLKSKMLMPSSWKSKNYNISKTVWPNPRWQTVTILKMKNRRLHFLISWICRVKMYLIGNKMADINIKDCSLSTVLTATDQKLQKLWKGDSASQLTFKQ